MKIFCGLHFDVRISVTDIFNLFANESGSYVVREEMETMLRACDGEVQLGVKNCFIEVGIIFCRGSELYFVCI